MPLPAHSQTTDLESLPQSFLPQGGEVRDGYRLANATVLRQRIDLSVMLFVVVASSLALHERAGFSDQGFVAAIVLGSQMVLCAAAVLLARWTKLRERLPLVTALLVGFLVVLVISQDVLLGLSREVAAVGLVSILAATMALFPWGWRAQLGVALASLVAFFIADSQAFAAPAGLHSHAALLTVAAATVFGAFYLDRYRFEAFKRSVYLEGLSRASQDEAQISEALVKAGQTLGSAVGREDVFDRVNQLVVEFLECDWSATIVADGDSFRLVGLFGASERVRAELESMEFDAADIAAFGSGEAETLIEIEDVEQASSPLGPVFAKMGVTAAIVAPIILAGEVVGIVANGYRGRRTAFQPQHRRITSGVAQATAIAVENHRLFDDLTRATRIKSEFASTMSHELRTPINVILGFARVLEDGDAGSLSEEQLDLVTRIRRSVLHLGELVEDVLDLGRLESGIERVKFDWLEMDSLVADLDEEFGPEAAGRDLCLEWRNRIVGLRIRTEGAHLRTILRHLIANALKFTNAGFIRIELLQSGASLVVMVTDSGIGIAPEEVDSIFDDFKQVDGSEARAFDGAGLGLHVVRRLVERVGGEVAVMSEPGKGSTFTVEIPAQFAKGRGA